ncbi:hypothetical protein ACFQ07_10890, partial [Actinomadura adrarensis]
DTDIEQTEWPRHLWDDRHTAELLQRCGGGDRAPFFHRDGTPLTDAELPATNPGADDPVRHTEWVTLLQEEGPALTAYADAGIDIDLTRPHTFRRLDPRAVLESLPVAPARLRAAIAELRTAGNTRHYRSLLLSLGDRHPHYVRMDVQPLPDDDFGLEARVVVDKPEPGWSASLVLPEALWRRLPDLDLLRAGMITPEELHPLVRSAL